MTRPGTVARFVRGKLIDTINGVVDTLNWIVSCWDRISCGPGISITGVNSGKPRVGLNLEAGENIKIENAGGGEFSTALRISAEGGTGGITACNIVSGSSSNIVGEATISEGVLTITLDVFYV